MKAGPQIGAGLSVAVAAIIAFASIFAAVSSQSSLPTATDIGSSEKPDAPTHVAAETKPAAPAQTEEPRGEQKATARQPAKEEPKESKLFSGVTTLDYRRIDRITLALVNEHRKEAGLEPVRWDFELAAIAGRHSASMITTGSFGHIDQSGFDVADRYRLNDISCSFPVTNKNAEGIFRSAKSVLEMEDGQIAAMMVGGWSKVAVENPDAERIGAGFALDSTGRLYSTINLC